MAARFAGRAVRTPQQLAETHFADLPSDRVEPALWHLAAELDAPLERLLPTDRLAHELCADPGWEFDSGHGLLAAELRRWAAARGARFESGSIETVEDYVRAFARWAPI
ncbi:MAG: hypothetical protein IPG63_15270 [Xanthomonadales bacterium]|nr:hypothetical protein [Xanthomonadales bacterium]